MQNMHAKSSTHRWRDAHAFLCTDTHTYTQTWTQRTRPQLPPCSLGLQSLSVYFQNLFSSECEEWINRYLPIALSSVCFFKGVINGNLLAYFTLPEVIVIDVFVILSLSVWVFHRVWEFCLSVSLSLSHLFYHLSLHMFGGSFILQLLLPAFVVCLYTSFL